MYIVKLSITSAIYLFIDTSIYLHIHPYPLAPRASHASRASLTRQARLGLVAFGFSDAAGGANESLLSAQVEEAHTAQSHPQTVDCGRCSLLSTR